jgi:hypothetical protein
MTDISVNKTSYQVEKLSWLLDRGGWEMDNVTLDVSAFTAGTHYLNGFIPSGTNLGKITATGLFGPYDNAATDGREVFRGHLGISTKVPNTADTTKDAGAPLLFAGVVKESKLPATVDAAGKADVAGWIRYL